MGIYDKFSGYYCIECGTLCHMYEQGLCCNCDQPWLTEVLNEREYPSKWKKVIVTVEEPNEEKT